MVWGCFGTRADRRDPGAHAIGGRDSPAFRTHPLPSVAPASPLERRSTGNDVVRERHPRCPCEHRVLLRREQARYRMTFAPARSAAAVVELERIGGHAVPCLDRQHASSLALPCTGLQNAVLPGYQAYDREELHDASWRRKTSYRVGVAGARETSLMNPTDRSKTSLPQAGDESSNPEQEAVTGEQAVAVLDRGRSPPPESSDAPQNTGSSEHDRQLFELAVELGKAVDA